MEGKVLKDRWRLLEKLDGEGPAVSYRAIDEKTGGQCVVKTLFVPDSKGWDEAEAFEREARTLRHLRHPRIPAYIDYFSEDEIRYFLVREYAPGKSLNEWMADGRRFAERDVRNIALSMAETLTYLHSFSPPVVHRDVSPGNIVLDADGTSRLIDFGSARERPGNVAESSVAGTFGYIAPEQAGGMEVPASNIYSLGVCLVYLLSRIPPLEMEEEDGRLQFRHHVNVSEPFARILEKMTAPSVKNRYGSASELLSDLIGLDGRTRNFAFGKRWSCGCLAAATALACAVGLAAVMYIFPPPPKSRRPPAESPQPSAESPRPSPQSPQPPAESPRPPVSSVAPRAAKGKKGGLVAYFPFDVSLADESFGGRTAVAFSEPEFVPGAKGQALRLDGRTACLEIVPAIVLPDDLTVSAWIMPRKSLEPNSAHTIFSVRDQCDSSWRGWNQVNFRIFRYGPDDLLYFGVEKTDSCSGGSNGDRYVAPEPNFAGLLDRWTFVAVTVRSNSSEHRRTNMYIDGERVRVDMIYNAPTRSAFSASRRYRAFVGCLDGSILHFDGCLDELRVYDRDLSFEEIEEIRAARE